MFSTDNHSYRTRPFHLTRRRVLIGAMGGVVALPVARIAWLWSKDQPLPPSPGDDLTLEGGWLLDAREASAPQGEAG